MELDKKILYADWLTSGGGLEAFQPVAVAYSGLDPSVALGVSEHDNVTTWEYSIHLMLCQSYGHGMKALPSAKLMHRNVVCRQLASFELVTMRHTA